MVSPVPGSGSAAGGAGDSDGTQGGRAQGVGRTGTLSLKTGLEQLTGRPCYHMLEVFSHPEHVTQWREAAEGGKADWAAMLRDRVRSHLGLSGLSLLA